MTDPEQPQSSGLFSAMDASKRRLLIVIASVLAFVLLCIGSVFAGISVGRASHAAEAAAHPSSSPTPSRAVPADKLAAQSIPTCSISGPASASSLQQLYGSVVNITTGKSVFARNDTTGEPQASGMKVLTAAAAISVLGPTFQITTQVQDAPQAGTIVLVGEGDATLSRVAAGQSVYAGAPTLASLASQTLTAYDTAHPGVPITKIVLDSSYWDPNDNWESSWPRTEQTGGYLSEATALQVDGDRANPAAQTSPRGTDPVMTAGQAFVTALGLDPNDVTLSTGTAETGAPVLASVKSQPVSTLVKQMLQNSDNTLAEMLARIVSVKETLSGSSASINDAISKAIDKFGVDPSSTNVEDGSGESDADSVPALFMSQFMAAVSKGQNGLSTVASALPVAGKTGSLAKRFTGANAIAAGKIWAKPGFIASAYSLSGYMTAADGTPLAFSFDGVGPGMTTAANSALDTLATAVFTCGKNLTNN